MTDPDAPAGVLASGPGSCPICGRPAVPQRRPFCSVRCADADLGHWLTRRYRVPGSPADPEAGEDGAGNGAGGRLDPEDGLG